MNTLARLGFLIAGMMLATAPASAVVVWDETANGDLSGDRLNPTSLTLVPGVNTLTATSVSGDREYFTFTLSAGMQLTAITLVSYTGLDGTAFIGVASGATMPVDPNAPNTALLLGYTHMGTGPGNVGTDILPNIGTGAGAIGFTAPLTAGTYTFWTQQAGVNPSTYQLSFTAIPEPSSMALAFGLAAGALVGWRRRRSGPRQVT